MLDESLCLRVVLWQVAALSVQRVGRRRRIRPAAGESGYDGAQERAHRIHDASRPTRSLCAIGFAGTP
jgi:hypothetical protein